MKEYKFKINGNNYDVAIDIHDANSAGVVVNGATYNVELTDSTIKSVVPKKPQVAAVPPTHPVTNFASPKPKPAASLGSGEAAVCSPLPGVIVDILVREGDTVEAGQTLIVLEAMKMENNIDADFAGTVKSIKVNRGDSVLEGDILVIRG